MIRLLVLVRKDNMALSVQKQLRTFKWRYIDNFAPWLAYRFDRPPLSGEADRVLSELDRNGIAVTSAQALLGPKSLYPELTASVDSLQNNLADQTTAARTAAKNPESHKSYILNLLGERPRLDPNDIFVRFALQRPVLQIANAYFGMYTRLRYYNVWHTFATHIPPRDSQLWHRDPEDYYILKMFVYLSDVGEDAGPVIYAPGSHLKIGLAREPSYNKKKGDAKRSDDSQMAEALPPEKWVQALGPRGTIIFADTRGYHKGGLARERDRLMYLCMFTSQAAKCHDLFERPSTIAAQLTKEQAFALAIR